MPKRTRTLATMAVLIAIEIVLERFLSFQTPIVRVSLGFLPIALSGVMFGPVAGGTVGGLSDILGTVLFSGAGYFPGFTISQVLAGMTYGFFLHNKKPTALRVALPVILITVILSLGLNSIWLYMITGKGLIAIIIPRIISNVMMMPVEFALIFLFARMPAIVSRGRLATAEHNRK